MSNPGDTYNPTHPTFGNTYAQSLTSCPTDVDDTHYKMVDWVYLDSATSDLRMTLLTCHTNLNGTIYFTQTISDWGKCLVQQISPYTNLPVCYTTEAGKYAQTAYLIGVVICQIINGFASIFKHKLDFTFSLSSKFTNLTLSKVRNFITSSGP